MCKPVRVFTHYSLCLVIVCKGNYYVKGGCIVVEWIISQSIEWEVTVYFKSRREYSLGACAQTKGLIKTVRATAARGFKYSENGPRWKLGWCNHIVWLMQLYGVADATIWPTWLGCWCNNMADDYTQSSEPPHAMFGLVQSSFSRRRVSTHRWCVCASHSE